MLALDAVVTALVVGAASALAPGSAATLITVVTWWAALAAFGAWSARPLGRCRPVVHAGGATAVVCWLGSATVLPPGVDRLQVALTGALLAGALAVRCLPASSPRPVVVAGDLDAVGSLVAELHREPRSWSVTSLCLDPADAVAGDTRLSDLAIHPEADAAARVALLTGARTVLLAPGEALGPEAIRRCTWAAHAAGLDVLVATSLLDVQPARVRPLSVGRASLALVTPGAGPTASRAVKHLVDRALALLLGLLLLPLLLLITLAVRWDSPGPVLFSQRRTGRHGSTFTMYKFRTMEVGAELRQRELAARNDTDGVLFKVRDDPRVTRVGRVLRRYSLDELPQLINVLRGEMSLVGPRPALPTEVAGYDEDPRRRLAVRPGLTGLWQVSGRSDLSWDETVRLDLHYVDNWCWRLDLRILARTVGAVLHHRGAY